MDTKRLKLDLQAHVNALVYEKEKAAMRSRQAVNKNSLDTAQHELGYSRGLDLAISCLISFMEEYGIELDA